MYNNAQHPSIQGNIEHVTKAERPPGRLFAVIIGISDYLLPDMRLGGAVVDAEAMKQYLKEMLYVPEEHILTLYDAQATRKAIIKAFRLLQNDRRINKGDPILIFYAGHGGELTAPASWHPHNMIQCLVPQDYAHAGNEPRPGHEPIPDRTIGALLEDIAEVKGNNITVIFDCCHSGSGTRDYDEAYVPRRVLLTKLKILETLDVDIWAGRVGITPYGFVKHGPPRSHVFLAACAEDELAYEHNRRGQFSTALLKELKDCSRNNELTCITYAKLIERIRLKHPQKQHPRCEGIYQHRLLFSGRFSSEREAYYPVLRKGGRYVIEAGLANGVSPGVEFTFYDDKQASALGVVLVQRDTSIEDFKTMLPTSVQPTGASFARLSGVGKLPLYVHPRNRSSAFEVLRHVDGYGTDAQFFRLVEAPEAKLEVLAESGSLAFKVLDRTVKQFGLTRLPYKATHSSVSNVMASAAHYYWFLDLSKRRDQNGLPYEVVVDFYPLDIDYDEQGEPLLFPREPGLRRKDLNLRNLDVIDFVVDPDAFYGMKVTNKTQWELYLNVFLFNNSSLSIVRYYTRSVEDKSPPLKRGGSFTIGDSAGTAPFQYSLEPNQHVDVGYLKVFFATWPIDLSDIAQLSPFSTADARKDDDETSKTRLTGVVKAMSRLLTPNRKPGSDDTWFTLDIPVVQRR